MKYYLQARLFPTVLTSVPLGVLAYVALQPYQDDLKEVMGFLPGASQGTLYMAFVFLAVQVNRVISIALFQNFLYKGELHMPTTCQLLWADDHIEESIKRRIRHKIKTRFDIELLSPEEEADDERKARKRITMAVSQIRNSLRGNSLLHQHNIEYGFWRNLIGGCVFATLLSVSLYGFAKHESLNWLRTLSVGMFLGYLIPVLLSKPLIGWYGRRYTKVLLEQFLSLPS